MSGGGRGTDQWDPVQMRRGSVTDGTGPSPTGRRQTGRSSGVLQGLCVRGRLQGREPGGRPVLGPQVPPPPPRRRTPPGESRDLTPTPRPSTARVVQHGVRTGRRVKDPRTEPVPHLFYLGYRNLTDPPRTGRAVPERRRPVGLWVRTLCPPREKTEGTSWDLRLKG